MKAVIIVSGGMDSVTMLYHIIKNGGVSVEHILAFEYGQRHYKELTYVPYHANVFSVPYSIIDLKSLISVFGESAMINLNRRVPEGRYQEEIIQDTVVPNRNMIFLSIAVAKAQSIGVNTVLYGAHTGDHAIYPDCTPAFINAISRAACLGNYKPMSISAPFILLNKVDILRHGLELNVDYSKTWTCYKGRNLACGTCSSCIERRGAFAALGEIDPLEYEQ